MPELRNRRGFSDYQSHVRHFRLTCARLGLLARDQRQDILARGFRIEERVARISGAQCVQHPHAQPAQPCGFPFHLLSVRRHKEECKDAIAMVLQKGIVRCIAWIGLQDFHAKAPQPACDEPPPEPPRAIQRNSALVAYFLQTHLPPRGDRP